jgi:superfamily II DNA or RNA helicase
MSLLDAIRGDAAEVPWSQGVRLARAGNVISVSESAEEIVLKVVVGRAPMPFTIHLWPDDKDWACSCGRDDEVCAHAAAGVIAWARAKKDGTPLPSTDDAQNASPTGPARAPATIGYRFTRTPEGFSLKRVMVHVGVDGPFRGTLVSGIPAGVPPLLSEGWDLELEQALHQRVDRPVPRELAGRILSLLAAAPDVKIDGEPIRTSGRPVVPVGRVDDEGNGFRVRVVRDRAIDEVFRNGAVRCGDLLQPVSRGDLSRQQYGALTRGIHYGPDDVQSLVSDALPALRRKIPVEIRTTRLPDVQASRPRLVIETTSRGESLVVKPILVYGDPPTARVERGELTVTGAFVPIRDRKAEERLVRQAGDKIGLPVGLERSYTGASAVRFVDKARSGGAVLLGEGWKVFQRTEQVAPEVRIDGERMHLDLGGADAHAVIKAWQAGNEMVRVKDGWAPLPTDWLSRFGHLVADLLEAREEDGTVAPHALFDLARLARELDQPPPPRLEGLQALLDDFSGIPSLPLPDDLTATLRPYQQQGVDWLRFLRRAGMGGILADDMGLGKTIQALCCFDGRTLVVAPTSVLHNWALEAKKFRPSLRVCIYHGPSRAMDPKADLVLTTYGLLRLDIELLCSEKWDVAVLDEAQAIKNPDSQVARAAYRLDAECRFTLTGTPVENRLEELWSQFHFTNRGLLGGRRDFGERYSRPISVGEPGVAAHLRERIKPFLLRRLKSQVAKDLPPRTDMTLYCTLSTEERDVYDAIRAATYERVVQELGQGKGVLAALEALLRLRQASCHTGLVPGQVADGSSKLTLLLETLDEVVSEGHKALVFSQWTGLLDRVEPHLRKAELPFVRLDGSTRDRQSIVERFQSPDGPPVFLVSLRAGGTGLNLTAADHVFLLDPWWNPAVEDQAADRAHRIGQDNPVMVYRLVAEETVEERILALQERKRALADAALGGADQAGGITKDELLALLA